MVEPPAVHFVSFLKFAQIDLSGNVPVMHEAIHSPSLSDAFEHYQASPDNLRQREKPAYADIDFRQWREMQDSELPKGGPVPAVKRAQVVPSPQRHCPAE